MSKIVRAFPLTPLQEGMLYHALRYPGSGLYHGQLAATLEGPLDARYFREAWARAASRHEVFRTFFTWEKRDRPIQVVRSEVDLPIRFLDWGELAEDEADRRWAALLEEDRNRPLDLTRAPMMRLTVAHLSPDRHRFLWGVHHSILDGWSGELVLGEVLDDVAALARGETPPSSSAPSYADFVGWLESRDHDRARTWWRRELAGAEASPLPVPETGRSGSRRLTAELALGEEATRQCRATATAHRVTLASLTVAAWSILIARRTGTRDALFGITMSERPAEIPDVHRAAGLYLATIPARIPVDPPADPAEWLGEVQRRSSEARSRAFLGLGELRRLSGDEGGEWLRSLVVFENFPDSITHEGRDGELRIGDVAMAGPSDLPLALLVYPSPSTLTLQIVHDPERISSEQADELLAELAGILARLGEGAETVGQLLTSTGDRDDVVPEEWCRGAELDPDAPDVMVLFDRQVSAHPNRVALRGPGRSLTYRELALEVDRVAQAVRARTPEGAGVGILARRGPDAVVGMLGVLRAGRFYMPFDPELPPTRIVDMATAADLVLTGDGHEVPPGLEDLPSMSISTAGAVPRGDNGVEARDPVPADAAAYVIHTSGSTGTPKGVVIERRHLAWSTAARMAYYEEHPGVFLLLSSVAVDSAVAGIYWTLCSGGTLLLPRHRAEQDAIALQALISDEQVTHTLLVPSLYRALLDGADTEALQSLRTVVVAGEACSPDVVRTHRELLPRVRLFNEYGPSEASVWATADELATDAGGGEVTIGRPVPGAQAWVLDADLCPVPVGEIGELVLGGPGIARGYLGRPDLTRERFATYSDAEGGRAYRTGDLARWRRDGRLDFLGRSDDQIKVRGYRVEAAEVERALTSHPAIDEAVVGLGARRGQEVLTAWFRARTPPNEESVRASLEALLPEYMVPQRLVLVDDIPRTAAGKIDRKALRAIAGRDITHESTAGERVAPRTPTERALAEVWAEVLGVSDIGVHDDFFSLGGDSLLSIRVMSRSARAGFRIDPERFFEEPTIAHLTASLAGGADSEDFEVVTGSAPLTPIQRWFLNGITSGTDHWNQAEVVDLRPDIETDRVGRAIHALLVHHDALRLRLDLGSSPPRQVIDPPGDTSAAFRVVDLAGAGSDLESRFVEEVDREHAALDITQGHLFRAVLFTGGDRDRLLLLAHHLVVDAVSWSILFDDLGALLEGADRLPGKSASALTWASELESRASEPEVEAMAAHWTSTPPPEPWTRLPVGIGGGPESNLVSTSRVEELVVDSTTTARLTSRAATPGAPSLQHLLLSALLLAWARWSERDGLQLHVEGLGRDILRGRLDASRTVGWFTSVYPLRLALPDPTPDAAARSVRAAFDDLPLGGDAFGLLRYLHPDPGVRNALGNAGRAELLFNFLGSVDGTIAADAPFVRSSAEKGVQRAPEAPRAYRVEINARLEGGRLNFAIEYSSALDDPRSIEAFARELRGAIDDFATTADRPRLDLVDLDAADLSEAGIDMGREIEDVHPLTPMQHLMLLHEMGSSGGGLLANRIVYEATGPLDVDALRRALERLVARHAALRSFVVWEGLDEPLQVVRRQVEPPLEIVDLRDLPAERAAIEARRRAEQVATLDVSTAPLTRVTVIRVAEERALLVWTLHHLVADRWSFAGIVDELGHGYRSIVEGSSPALRPAPGFRDYLAWMRRADDAASDEYWRHHLRGFTRPTPLVSAPPPARAERVGTMVSLDSEIAEALGAAAAQARVGQATFVLGALGLEVARRTARRDVVVGLTVSGRPPELEGVEDIVGSFVNNVPLRLRIDPKSTRDDWLRELQLEQVRRQPHEHRSLAAIHGLAELRPSEALFDLLAVVNLDPVEDPDFGPMAVRPLRATLDGGYPLVLEVARVEDHLRLQLIHHPGFDEARPLLDGLGDTLRALCRSSGSAPLGEITDIAEPTTDAPPAPEPARDPHDPSPAVVGETGRAGRTGDAPTSSSDDPSRVIRTAWTEILGLRDADPSDDFFEVGGTSLQGAQLLARIESDLGRRVPIAVLVSGRTLGALLKAVEAPPQDTGPLVCLREGGHQAPLVAVPGVNGNLLLYPPFAEALRPGRPVYGLQTRGVDGERGLLTSMDAIANDFADQLRGLADEPLHLFGLCWGAAAAFEVAAVLEARGTPPASVCLLDPTALGLNVGADGRSRARGRIGFILDRLTMYADEFSTLDWAGRRRMLTEKVDRVSRVVTGRTEEATREELRKRAVIESNLRALKGYRPATVSSPARMFLATDFEHGQGNDHRLEWLDHFDPPASVVQVPGFDSGDVIKTHTAALTKAVDAWLDEIEGAEV